MTFQQVQKYENGANRVFFSRLVQIAHALGLRLGELVGDIDEGSGLSGADTLVLDALSTPGALELSQDFAKLPVVTRSALRKPVREMVQPS